MAWGLGQLLGFRLNSRKFRLEVGFGRPHGLWGTQEVFGQKTSEHCAAWNGIIRRCQKGAIHQAAPQKIAVPHSSVDISNFDLSQEIQVQYKHAMNAATCKQKEKQTCLESWLSEDSKIRLSSARRTLVDTVSTDCFLNT